MKNLILLVTTTVGLIGSFTAAALTQYTAEQGNLLNKYYVGADNDCDFSTIQAGINAANASQDQASVFIAFNKTYKENLTINHNNIHLDGSYPDCTLARLGIAGREKAKIRGFEIGDPIMYITGLNVSLSQMNVSDHIDGGLLADATSNITLNNMEFTQLGQLTTNDDVFNAVKLSGNGQIDLHVINSDFSLNIAKNGAAIYCDGGNHSIDITGSLFLDNTAATNGGAVSINGCDLTTLDSVFENNSARFGGALYLTLSAAILNKTTFVANTVDGSGGAIVGLNSTINSDAVYFVNNQSGSFGGAVSLSSSDFIVMNNSDNCINKDKCNLFNNNKAGFAGGAIGSEFGLIKIIGSHFENNRADFGTALYLTNSNTSLIEGSVFTHNGDGGGLDYLDQNVVFLDESTVARISYSTFADNKTNVSTFNQEDSTSLRVYSSIVYDPASGDVFVTSITAELFINCIITHEDQSFESNFSDFVTVADPMFVSPINGDYHINVATSPAVDYCTDTIALAEYPDIDHQVRGFDDPNIPNNLNTNGTYDIGADEVHDIIFADDFE